MRGRAHGAQHWQDEIDELHGVTIEDAMIVHGIGPVRSTQQFSVAAVDRPAVCSEYATDLQLVDERAQVGIRERRAAHGADTLALSKRTCSSIGPYEKKCGTRLTLSAPGSRRQFRLFANSFVNRMRISARASRFPTQVCAP